MKKSLLGVVIGVAAVLSVVAADPAVLNVIAKQRYPWNGKVDIWYEVVGNVAAGLPGWNIPSLCVSATNRVARTNYVAKAITLSGDTGIAEGIHHVVWDLNAQGLEFKSDDVVFTVAYNYYEKYCVIDLSAGANAATYPVSYLADVPDGGWTDEYKTTKLVLRVIEPGSFKMCGSYDVTLTRPYYMGVFEVTQKQYELVTGGNPSRYKGDMRQLAKFSDCRSEFVCGQDSGADGSELRSADRGAVGVCLPSRDDKCLQQWW